MGTEVLNVIPVIIVDKDNKLKTTRARHTKRIESGIYDAWDPRDYIYVHEKAVLKEGADGLVVIETDEATLHLNPANITYYGKDGFYFAEHSLNFHDVTFDEEEGGVAFFCPVNRIYPSQLGKVFTVSFEFKADFDENCAVCTTYREHANMISNMLPNAFFVMKNVPLDSLKFFPKNMKRVIFVDYYSLLNIVEWFVATFNETLARAKIQRVIIEDLETRERFYCYVEDETND